MGKPTSLVHIPSSPMTTTQGGIESGETRLVCPEASFSVLDVGKTVEVDQAGPEGAVLQAKIIAFEPPPSGATTGPTVRLNQAAAQAVTDVEVRYWADVQCEISQADLQLGPSSVGLFVGNTASNVSLSSLIARPKQTSSQEVGVMAAAQASLTIAESVDLSTLNTSVTRF